MDGDQKIENQNPEGGSNGTAGATGDTNTSVLDAFKGVSNGEDNGTKKNEAEPKPNTNTPKSDDSANYELKPWGDQLSKDLKDNKEVKKALSKFNDISALASSYLELEKKLGNMSVIPGENATDEELQSFYKKIGKPETADKYSFEQKTEAEKKLAEIAFNTNLSDGQAKAVYDFLYSQGKAQEQLIQKALKEQAIKTDTDLKKEYGNLIGEKMNSYTKGLKLFADDNVLKDLETTGLAFNKGFVKMFIKIGEALGESKAIVNGGSSENEKIKTINEGGSFSFYG